VVISTLGPWRSNARSLALIATFSEGCRGTPLYSCILSPAVLRLPKLHALAKDAWIKALFLFPLPGASFMT
jgi:hypothetical protein